MLARVVLLVLVGLTLCPALGFLVSRTSAHERRDAVAFERASIARTDAWLELLYQLERHRIASSAVMFGADELKHEVTASTQGVEAAFDALEQIHDPWVIPTR